GDATTLTNGPGGCELVCCGAQENAESAAAAQTDVVTDRRVEAMCPPDIPAVATPAVPCCGGASNAAPRWKQAFRQHGKGKCSHLQGTYFGARTVTTSRCGGWNAAGMYVSTIPHTRRTRPPRAIFAPRARVSRCRQFHHPAQCGIADGAQRM